MTTEPIVLVNVLKVAPGKQADLIVIDGDPSKNIADTQKIVMVFHQGREVKAE